MSPKITRSYRKFVIFMVYFKIIYIILAAFWILFFYLNYKYIHNETIQNIFSNLHDVMFYITAAFFMILSSFFLYIFIDSPFTFMYNDLTKNPPTYTIPVSFVLMIWLIMTWVLVANILAIYSKQTNQWFLLEYIF